MFYDLWNGRMVVHMNIKGGNCQSEVNTKWLHDLFRNTETKIIIRLHLDVDVGVDVDVDVDVDADHNLTDVEKVRQDILTLS